MAKAYPTPCVRFIDLPTGERNYLFEIPSGCTVPFKTEFEARSYVLDRQIHRKYGRVFIETSPKKFATMLVDDRGDEDEVDASED